MLARRMQMSTASTSRVYTGFATTWLIEEDDKTVTLPLRSGYNYNMIVDWGDGNTSEITSYDQVDITHTYNTAGTKTVEITGQCEAWYFNNGGDKLKFRTVENWGDVGFTGLGLESAFLGCSYATSFGNEMPAYEVTSLKFTWGNCSSATSFPAVSNLTSVTSLYYTWYYCSSATSFPDVNALTSVTELRNTWYGCSSATSFPAVSNLTSVTNLSYAWKNCSAVTVIPSLPSSSTALTITSSAFDGCGSGMLGTAVDLWNTTNFPNITSYVNTFAGATGLTNYADIPSAWKGL